jgi:hypothetical protein
MSGPIVFVSHVRVKPSKVEAYRQLQHDIARVLHAEKPRTLVFVTYLSDDGSDMTAVHVFPDANSMDLPFEGSDKRSEAAYEYLVPAGWEIYGTASDAVLEEMRQAAAASGATLAVQPEYVAGFLRPT